MRVCLVLILAAACSKGPPTIDPAPKNVESPDQNPPPPPKPDAPGPDAPPGTDPAADPGFFAPREIHPPPLKNLAPGKTTAAIPDPTLAMLGAIESPFWHRETPGVSSHVGVFHYKTVDRPYVSVDIVVAPCVIANENKCIPTTDLAKWQAADNAEMLDEFFPPALRTVSTTKSESGSLPLGEDSAPAIFEYHLGATSSTDIRGRTHAITSHGYTLHYNDGTNRIRVSAYYDDVAAPKDVTSKDGLDKLAAAVTKDQLVQTARGFFELFTSQWSKR